MSDAPSRDCTGVVLAGGRSSRMGQDKASLVIGGAPLLQRVVGRLRVALDEVLVIGPDQLSTLVPGVWVAPDREPGAGPLGGLVTALSLLRTPRIFLVACDMPFVAPQLIRAMAALSSEPSSERAAADAVLLRTGRGLEYLHGVYSRSCLPAAERALASEDRSLHGLVASLAVRELTLEWAAAFDPAGLSTFNANTPEDWRRAVALAASRAVDIE